MTREDIMDLLRENKGSLERFGVRRLALFGSRAREDAQPGSDLDFLVEFEKKSFDAYMDLKFFLEELFGASVDLVLTNTIKPRLRDRILEEALDVPGLERLSRGYHRGHWLHQRIHCRVFIRGLHQGQENQGCRSPKS